MVTQKAERGQFGREILTRQICVDYTSAEDVLLAITIHSRRPCDLYTPGRHFERLYEGSSF